MILRDLHRKLIRRLRVLTYGLVLSLIFNLFLIVHFIFEKRNDFFSLPSRPFIASAQEELKLVDVLQKYSQQSFKELVDQLEKKEIVEQGYAKRDLALASLVAFHHFDLKKAIGSMDLEKKKILLKEDGSLVVTLFSGIDDFQYDAILHFARTEKWPLTIEGMFYLLKKWPDPKEPTMVQAFCMSEEFDLLRNLFRTSENRIEDFKLLTLILENRFEVFDNFVFEQKQIQDLSQNRRISFILPFLEEKSLTAAEMILQSDFSYAITHFSDHEVTLILEILKQQSPPSSLEKEFCKALSTHLRSQEVKNLCLARFPDLVEAKPEPLPFVKKVEIRKTKTPTIRAPKVLAKKENFHVVQEGENLWKIARKYHVEMDRLRKANHLQKDRLHPGLKLVIPKKN